MSEHTTELAKKRALLAAVDAMVRNPFLSYEQTIDLIGRLIAPEYRPPNPRRK